MMKALQRILRLPAGRAPLNSNPEAPGAPPEPVRIIRDTSDIPPFRPPCRRDNPTNLMAVQSRRDPAKWLPVQHVGRDPQGREVWTVCATTTTLGSELAGDLNSLDGSAYGHRIGIIQRAAGLPEKEPEQRRRPAPTGAG